jgi:hypothetical protein
MSATPDRPTFRAKGPAEMLALVPYLLGYHPTSSLVALVLTGSRLRYARRLDLPDSPGDIVWTAAAHHMVAAMNTAEVTGVILIGYGPHAQVQPSLDAVTDMLADRSIPVVDALRVDEDRYWSCRCSNPDCCPPEGTPFDPTTTAAAATATAAGLVALPNRAALAARLDPVTGHARRRMAYAALAAAQSILELIETIAPDAGDDVDTSPGTRVGRALLSAGRTQLAEARRSYQAGTPVNDALAALATILLDLPSVRRLAATQTTGQRWELNMWTDLVRRAEPDFTAGPATLLALAALHAGDGTLAAIAVQRALHADPDDPLAHRIADAIAAGATPDTITTLLAD